MTPAVLGLDVSPLRMGWGLVSLDEGIAIACGMERIDLPHKVWSHEQVADAVAVVDALCRHHRCEVSVIAIEWPTPNHRQRGVSVVNIGRAMQEGLSAARRRWPTATVHELLPNEWKKGAGLAGNATKQAVMEAAVVLLPRPMVQDAADALMIAVAGQRLNAAIWQRGVERGAA